ncbi:MAG: aminotransferase class I/II-fold pyridoxal phosphate-dependent enzyme [Deltaproteobacteria bacterium]|nr:aminotransferase class I/II-fold pyridoxal phosphate-dependent enzyme [Deltaproteobacteria bacterium]MBW2532499.1 aminotransferase class I/II-fold pyridoxal phosphate-dependent enzyme [Deltaproteobacteria bacterium]
MSLSQVASELSESPTLALNEQARLLRMRGEPVIHLGAGEPKNRAPVTALLGAAATLKEGDIKYTPTEGTTALRQAVIRYTEENYGRAVAPENVIVSNGAKQAVWNVLYSILNPQDEVVILTPYWVSYPEMVKMMYGVPVIVAPEDGSFQPRLEEVEQAIGSYTKAIIVNSPNNPSGVMYSRDFIAALVELCEKKNIWFISDDIYHKLIFDGKQWTSPYQFSSKHVDESHIITLNGVSKLYGMTGFRIGWAVAPRKLVSVMSNVQAQITSTASAVLQAAAASALTGVQSTIEALRQMLENNRNILMNELKAFPDVKCIPPDGTFYCLPDFSAYEKDSLKLCKLLLDKARVVTVPGKEFGMEGHLRISICGSVADIKKGMERIKWAIDPESPNELFIGERKYVRDWL